jgi:hypothetical protein
MDCSGRGICKCWYVQRQLDTLLITHSFCRLVDVGGRLLTMQPLSF